MRDGELGIGADLFKGSDKVLWGKVEVVVEVVEKGWG